MKNRSKTLIISMVLGVGYSIYLMSYFYNITMCGSGMDFIVGSLASAIVFPHMMSVGIGLIFNMLGYFLNNRAFVLVGAILYSVSILLFMMYFMFVIVQMILSYIAFAKMKKA